MLYAFKNIIDTDAIKVPKTDKVAKTLSQYLSSYEIVVKTRTSISNHIKSLEYVTSTSKNILRKLRERYHNLLAIPGVGRVTAIALLYVS